MDAGPDIHGEKKLHFLKIMIGSRYTMTIYFLVCMDVFLIGNNKVYELLLTVDMLGNRRVFLYSER